MIARLKIAAAAAILIGSLTCLATGLAAMVPATPDAPRAGRRRSRSWETSPRTATRRARPRPPRQRR